jgi:hypothetical protein
MTTDTTRVCKGCAAPLTEANWYPSFVKSRNYTCKACSASTSKAKPKAVTAEPTTKPLKFHGRATQTVLDDLHYRVATSLSQLFRDCETKDELPSVALLDRAMKFLSQTDSSSPGRDNAKVDRLASLRADYVADRDESTGVKPELDFTLPKVTPSQAMAHPLVTPDAAQGGREGHCGTDEFPS